MVKALTIMMNALALATLIVGVSVLFERLDIAAMFDLPPSFNKSSSLIMIVTGAWVLAIPYLPAYRK